MGFDVVTPPVLLDADPSAPLFAWLTGPVCSYDGEIIETDLGVWDVLIEPGFNQGDDTGFPEGSLHQALGVK